MTFNIRAILIKFHDHSRLFHQSLKNLAVFERFFLAVTRFSSRCGLSAGTTKKLKELSGPFGEVAVIGVSTVVQLFQRKELPYRSFQ